MSSGGGIDVEQAARLFLRFLDLSRDVERNRADSVDRETNVISYVMDAGIVEVFLNARDRRGRSASLHSPEWCIGQTMPSDWRNYAAQTALVTADYLFGGTLPGQQAGRIWMSIWHGKEMVRRLEQVELENIIRFRELNRDKAALDRAMERFESVHRSVDAFKGTGRIPNQYPADSLLQQDVTRYLQHAKAVDIETTVFTRLALNVIANDHYIEPPEQLKRFVAPPLRRRLATLESSLRIEKSDLDLMAQRSRDWFHALVRECRGRGIKVEEGGDTEEKQGRSAAALWDDARTLALVCWASARAQSGSRIVFVTADTVLFDTYRRWYANLSLDDEAYLQPFCLRRLRQYAPSFNLIDSGLVQGARYRQLFKDIDDILELMVLPLNLSRRQSKSGEHVVDRMRELTALRNLDTKPIATDKSYRQLIETIEKNGVEAFGQQLATLMDRWRELERAALGQADTEVQRRVTSDKEWLIRLSSDASARAEAFERYVDNVVARIAEGSRAVSLLLAREVIGGWRPPGNAQIVRAPLALRLVVRLANESVDVGAALMLKLEPDAGVGDSTARAPLIREDQWPDLYAKPSIMFAIASALSIATGDWADATHFADRALKISGATSDGDEKEISLEIRYLVALAKRFHIGDIGPATTETAGNRIIGLHREALELNSQCLSMQSREGGQTTLRELRSYSERAALRLFYVAAFNPKIVRLAMSGTQAESAPPRGLRGPDAEYELDRAEDDLRVCFAIDQIEVPSEDTPRTSFKKRLRRQIYTNAVASYLLRKLWGFEVPNESLFSPKNIVAMKRARDETLHNRGANVMTAEILAFRALAGDDSARRDLKGLQLPRERVLRLDSHVVAALKILVSDWSFTRIS